MPDFTVELMFVGKQLILRHAECQAPGHITQQPECSVAGFCRHHDRALYKTAHFVAIRDSFRQNKLSVVYRLIDIGKTVAYVTEDFVACLRG